MMNRTIGPVLLVALLLPLAAGCACTDSGSADSQSNSASTGAELAGTVLDRATGTPIEGAEVVLPNGRKAKSDAAGRFLIKDLAEGLSGPVTARASDGREGRVTLRPLAPGRLEVVLLVGR